MTDINTFNKRFAELAGICWHEWHDHRPQYQQFTCLKCGLTTEHPCQPNFAADPVAVLEVMMKREDDWIDFAEKILTGGYINATNVVCYFIEGLLLDTTVPCKMAVEAMKWMEERK
jgi:hypothetical protein